LTNLQVKYNTSQQNKKMTHRGRSLTMKVAYTLREKLIMRYYNHLSILERENIFLFHL
jgi:hypothetical protein